MKHIIILSILAIVASSYDNMINIIEPKLTDLSGIMPSNEIVFIILLGGLLYTIFNDN